MKKTPSGMRPAIDLDAVERALTPDALFREEMPTREYTFEELETALALSMRAGEGVERG